MCPKCNTPFRYEDLEFNHSINVSTTNYIIVQKRIGPLVLTKQFPRIRVGGPNNLSNTGFVGWTVRTSIFAPRLLEANTNEILNDEGLRNRHEFVYHKILDCLGDIMLSGNRIFGHIKTSQGGHALTNKLLKKFFSEKSNWSFENSEKQNQNTYENPVAIGV